jgi:hypothetical protein
VEVAMNKEDLIADINYAGASTEPAEPITLRQVVTWVSIGVGIAAGHLLLVAAAARLG